jgi:hypothetical protein
VPDHHEAHRTLPHPLGAAIQAPRHRRCGTALPPSPAPLGRSHAAHAHGSASMAAAYRLRREPPANGVPADDVRVHLEKGTDQVWPVSQLRHLETSRCRPRVLGIDVRPIRTALPSEPGELRRPSSRDHPRPPTPSWHSATPGPPSGSPPAVTPALSYVRKHSHCTCTQYDFQCTEIQLSFVIRFSPHFRLRSSGCDVPYK